ncbi:MAG: hypothetical protein ACI87W_000090 [Halieaceae bacterium]|jgi:hypothetical protein
MNRPDQDAPEYFAAGTDFLADDEVPETLLAVLRVLAQPYRFYLLQRVQAIYASLSAVEQASVKQMLDACGLSGILSIALDRRLARADNLEVCQD